MNRIMQLSALIALGLFLLGCASVPQPLIPCNSSVKVPDGPLNNASRKYVYKDLLSPTARGEWSNWMTTKGKDPSSYIKDVALDDRTLPFGGSGESVRINFHLGQNDWAGVAVASYPNCWGKRCCPAFYDLAGARRLVFYARGTHGGESIEVKTSILGDMPYGDSAPYPATSGRLQLERDWHRYEVDCQKTDLSRVVTPFSVFVAGPQNIGDVEIFLDEIYFEF